MAGFYGAGSQPAFRDLTGTLSRLRSSSARGQSVLGAERSYALQRHRASERTNVGAVLYEARGKRTAFYWREMTVSLTP